MRSLPPDVVAEWSDLEARALEPNAYLSPLFVLPSARYIHPHVTLLALLVERRAADGTRKLVAAMVVQPVTATRSFPLPHLIAYHSRYTFLSGILLDRDHATEAMEALLEHVRKQWQWHGIELEEVWGDGATWDLLQRINEQRRMRLQVWNEAKRAVLQPSIDRERIQANEAAETHALRRRIKRLSEKGEVSWSIVARGGVPEASMDAFIELEHRGWKGEGGSSLRSNPATEAFFREVVKGFAAHDRAVFVELQLDGKVVAASSNFISGHSGFAFKIGWLPELAPMSPGRLAELELLRQLYQHEVLSNLQFFDSGAVEGSYIEKLWPGRRKLVTLGIGCSLVGAGALAAVHTARMIKRELRTRLETTVVPGERPPTEAKPTPTA